MNEGIDPVAVNVAEEPATFTRQWTGEAGEFRVVVAGEVDLSNAGRLVEALRAYPAQTRVVVADLVDVHYASSAALSALVMARAEAARAAVRWRVVVRAGGRWTLPWRWPV